MAGERSIGHVPAAVVAGLAVLLAAQFAFRAFAPAPAMQASDLPTPPSPQALRFASLGDPVPLAKGLMLYLQAFDYRAGNMIAYQALDYARLETWLSRILALDPAGQYPLMAASRLYADVPDEAKVRRMLEFAYREFQKDPNRRWPWLAQAAAIAKHRLHDLPLARAYAAAIQERATGDAVPAWAKQMEAFILEDMNELETARIMIGGFIEKGMVKDPGELRFLEQRLQQLQQRSRTKPDSPAR
jgi:hypothetical protein